MTSDQIREEFEHKLDACDTVEISALSELIKDSHEFGEEAGDEFVQAVEEVQSHRPRGRGRRAKG